MTAEWYYVGHYGQLGPLTFEQVEELVRDGVIERDTYVWRAGMSDWQPAAFHRDLQSFFQSVQAAMPPPPPVPLARQSAPATAYALRQPWRLIDVPVSDRKRWIAGVLQLLIPGSGRIYLGYAAQGVIQFILFTPCGLGVGWLWSIIDGIVILAGGVKLDGYGRKLVE